MHSAQKSMHSTSLHSSECKAGLHADADNLYGDASMRNRRLMQKFLFVILHNI